jgi:hypothetical protein
MRANAGGNRPKTPFFVWYNTARNLRPLQCQRASSLHLWFFSVPSEDLHRMIGRGGVRQFVIAGSTAPGPRQGRGACGTDSLRCCDQRSLLSDSDHDPRNGVPKYFGLNDGLYNSSGAYPGSTRSTATNPSRGPSTPGATSITRGNMAGSQIAPTVLGPCPAFMPRCSHHRSAGPERLLFSPDSTAVEAFRRECTESASDCPLGSSLSPRARARARRWCRVECRPG